MRREGEGERVYTRSSHTGLMQVVPGHPLAHEDAGRRAWLQPCRPVPGDRPWPSLRVCLRPRRWAARKLLDAKHGVKHALS